MELNNTDNLNIESQFMLVNPEQLKTSMTVSESGTKTVSDSRRVIKNILEKKDHRLIAIVGPCSIHDVESALEYAKRLKALSEKLSDTLYIVMRVYFEKPRTTVGWKGLINDPHLDNSFRIEEGLQMARRLLMEITSMGVPVATEALDPVAPQYLSDLISWYAIGARTTESQTHREMASGLSSPVGFKNATDGSLMVAVNALKSSSHPHRFLGINGQGQVAVIKTKGNDYSHIVLRGGDGGPNYDRQSVGKCEAVLADAGLEPAIMVDCSHANSGKDPTRQPLVVSDIASQIQQGNRSVVGFMMESHLNFGNQSLDVKGKEELRHGVSITDSCLDWSSTESCLINLANDIRVALRARCQSELEPA